MYPQLHLIFLDHKTAVVKFHIGISTNGVPLNEDMIDAIVENAYFCVVIIDAGTRRTWSTLKGCNDWNKLMDNCSSLTVKGRKKGLDTTYKFLISEGNQYEILDACIKARDLGFKNFFVRPAAFEKLLGVNLNYAFDVENIKKQIEEAYKLETNYFKVFGNFGRVDEKMRAFHPYSSCHVSPLAVVMCADGYCYLCIDKRERPEVRMCKHEEIRNYWNSKEHHDMIRNIKVSECPRCTFGNYNEQFECIMKDTFAMWFP